VARRRGTFTGGLIEEWAPLYRSEFQGVTTDGAVREGLFPLEPAAPGEEAPAAAMVAAAEHLPRTVDDESRDRLTHVGAAVAGPASLTGPAVPWGAPSGGGTRATRGPGPARTVATARNRRRFPWAERHAPFHTRRAGPRSWT
jgi:hypothetical protein